MSSTPPESWRVEEAREGRHYDLDGNPVDETGKRLPQRLSMPLFMRSIPGLREQFDRQVPPPYVTEDVEEGTWIAEIACPCGSRPLVELSVTTGCEGCERHYYFAGAPGRSGRRAVFVAFSPIPKPATPAAS